MSVMKAFRARLRRVSHVPLDTRREPDRRNDVSLTTACLFWWALIHGRYERVGYGAAVVFVFATAVHREALSSK
jgi:hypothetical protein